MKLTGKGNLSVGWQGTGIVTEWLDSKLWPVTGQVGRGAHVQEQIRGKANLMASNSVAGGGSVLGGAWTGRHGVRWGLLRFL